MDPESNLDGVCTVECPLCYLDYPPECIEEHVNHCMNCLSPSDAYETLFQSNDISPVQTPADTPDINMTRQSRGGKEIFKCHQVFIHPNMLQTNHIEGLLQLCKRGSDIYIVWRPKEDESFLLVQGIPSISSLNIDPTLQDIYRETPQYRINHNIDFIYSIRRFVPNIGYSHIVIQLKGGLTLEPLYFHGGYNQMIHFFEKLGQLVDLKREPEDPDLYLVDKLTPIIVEPIEPSQHKKIATPVAPVSPSLRDAGKDFASWTINQFTKVRRAVDVLSVGGTNEVKPSTSFKRRPNAQILSNPFDDTDVDMHEFEIVAASEFSPSSPCSGSQSNGVRRAQDRDRHRAYLLPSKLRVKSPMTQSQWRLLFDSKGAIDDPLYVKTLIANHGIANEIRGEVWLYLLGVNPWQSTAREREVLYKERKAEYYIYKSQWMSITPRQAKRFYKFRDRRYRIQKDVERTDRSQLFFQSHESSGLTRLNDILLTYAFYNFDLAYVQGMNDLLAPILSVIDDESDSFWCFANLMDRLERNFHKNQEGVHDLLGYIKSLLAYVDPELLARLRESDKELHFCFRWVLVNFKREFDYKSIMSLWEVMWTDYLSCNWVVFVSVAILLEHREHYLKPDLGLDGLVMYTNDLAMTLDCDVIMARAEHVFAACLEEAATLPDDVRELMGLTPPPLSPSNSQPPNHDEYIE